MTMPDRTPQARLACATIRAIDARAIEVLGVPGLILMENAARGAAEVIQQEVATRLIDTSSAPIVVLCGPGNNGGDGFAIARHLAATDREVFIVLACRADAIRGDARVNFEIARRIGLPIIGAFETEGMLRTAAMLAKASVIIDALLGTGSRGAPTSVIGELVRAANTARGPLKVAVDIPTGLDGDSGKPETPCFRADLTVTFVAEKTSFGESAARDVLGRVVVVGLGVPLKNLLGDEKTA